MRLPERHAPAHQVIRQIRGQERGVAGGPFAGGGIDLGVLQHRAHQPGRGADGVGRVEQPLLVLLQIAVVGHRQPLQQGQHGHEVAHDAAGLAAREFRDVGVFFLRHQRRARGVGVGNPDEIEFRAGPQDHVLRQPREMHRQERGGRAEFHDEIPVADGVHGVLRQLRPAGRVHEVEQPGNQLPVQRQGGSGDGAAAEGADVHAPVAVPETLAVPLQHLHIGQQVMGKIDRLGALQMGVAGNHDAVILLAQRNEGALESGNVAEQLGDFIAQPEADVKGHLVVARAGGVQFGPGGNPTSQLRLDIHVDVLQLRLP